MSKAEHVEVDCRMDNLALGKNIRRFAQDSRLAGSHRARNDQQRFRKPSIAFDAFTVSPKENSQTDPRREIARAVPCATTVQLVIRYPTLASLCAVHRLICTELRKVYRFR